MKKFKHTNEELESAKENRRCYRCKKIHNGTKADEEYCKSLDT